MSAGFTPGPWSAGKRFANEGFSVFREERGTGWLRQHRLDAAYDGTFREPDARLIAAAQDLFEVAERCRDTFRLYADLHRIKLSNPANDESERLSIQEKIARNEQMRDLCDAALAKARGQ